MLSGLFNFVKNYAMLKIVHTLINKLKRLEVNLNGEQKNGDEG